jgi:colanic acid biosynthesis glycosyl transferase WcaI
MPGKAPRILFLSISWDPEPGPLRGQPLAKWLSERGYQVEALTSVPSYPLGRVYPGYKMRLWQWEVMDGIRVLRVPLYPSHDNSALRRITTYISFMFAAMVFGIPQIKRPDVVYYFDNLPTTGAVAWLISLIYGAKTVQHIADMWPDTPLESGMLKNPTLKKMVHGMVGGWCKFLYKRHKKISVLSPGFRRMLLERGVPDEKIVVSYNWADESKFFPVPAQPSLLRELDIEGRFNVLYAGNIGPLQAIENVVRAAHLLRDHPTLQILIFGTGPSEQAVIALAQELKVNNVRFMGSRPVSEMNAIIPRSIVCSSFCGTFLSYTAPSPVRRR